MIRSYFNHSPVEHVSSFNDKLILNKKKQTLTDDQRTCYSGTSKQKQVSFKDQDSLVDIREDNSEVSKFYQLTEEEI